MKKSFYPLLLSSTFVLLAITTYAQLTTAAFRPKGKISPNSENANKEPDPSFSSVLINPYASKKIGGSGNEQSVSQLEHGMQIVKDVVGRFIQNEYGFSLLSAHKYMVNSCLGIKVSSGQFVLKFSDPDIELSADGKFSVKLKVDRIKFSAFKIRSKPRSPDLSDPDPCNFSGKFEIGGEASDVSVKIVLDLVAQAAQATSGFCYFSFDEPANITWKIGGFNLRPMPNVLDNVAKEMVEDALNQGMFDLVYNKFIQLTREVIPEYYSVCNEIYNSEKVVKTISNTWKESGAADETEHWVSNPLKTAAKKMGRLNLGFPKDVEWDVDVYSAARKFIINRSSSGNHKFYDLAPGSYNVKLNTVPVDNVLIQEGKETRIKTGILTIKAVGHWDLRTSAEKFLTSGNRPKKLALPVGKYLIQLDKRKELIEITDGVEIKVE